jgi:hypothetical protein
MNYVFQKHVTHSLQHNRADFNARLDVANSHLKFYHSHVGGLPKAVLELGSGWQPIVPVAFWLCGTSGTLTSIDIEDLRREEQVFDMLKTFEELEPGELLRRLPLLRMDRFRRLQDEVRTMDPSGAQRFLMEAGIRFVVGDACRTDFPSHHFDQIISNYTFEHIPRATLEGILAEFRRVLSPTGLMTHLIDMSDHYSHFDPSITPYNFLRYPRWRWRWFNNSLQYQNRLRASDYRALHIAAGLQILEERLGTNRMGELDAVPLAPEFEGYSRTDLAATHAWLVSRIS